MDDFHSFYTRLQAQAVSTPEALDRVKAIAEETPNWDSLSPADKSKLVIEKDPELAQGRLWIKAFTPDQNIAVNDFLKDNWNAKLYGSATMHAYFDSQLRLGHDADIALGMGATDEQGAQLAKEIADVANNEDPGNPSTASIIAKLKGILGNNMVCLQSPNLEGIFRVPSKFNQASALTFFQNYGGSVPQVYSVLNAKLSPNENP